MGDGKVWFGGPEVSLRNPFRVPRKRASVEREARSVAKNLQQNKIAALSRDNLSRIFTRPLKTLAKIYSRACWKAFRTFRTRIVRQPLFGI